MTRMKTQKDLLRARSLRDEAMMADRGRQPTLAEVFPETAIDAAAVGFALAHLDPARPLLWIQDRLSRHETGRPYLPGLPRRFEILHLDVRRPVDVLWAMEEGLRCPDLGGVIAEVWGRHPAIDFTATKRLALRSEAHAVPAWLIRRATDPDLSAARERWRVASLASLPDPDDARSPGQPLWRVELFRSRFRAPGRWVAQFDGRELVMEHGQDIDALPDRQLAHA